MKIQHTKNLWDTLKAVPWEKCIDSSECCLKQPGKGTNKWLNVVTQKKLKEQEKNLIPVDGKK